MNNSAILAKKCEKLLKDAQLVFGKSLVVDAWHIIDVVNSGIKFTDKERCKALSESYEQSNDNSIDLCTARSIMIEFRNGSKVIFHTSEWGGMERPDAPIEFV